MASNDKITKSQQYPEDVQEYLKNYEEAQSIDDLYSPDPTLRLKALEKHENIQDATGKLVVSLLGGIRLPVQLAKVLFLTSLINRMQEAKSKKLPWFEGLR